MERGGSDLGATCFNYDTGHVRCTITFSRDAAEQRYRRVCPSAKRECHPGTRYQYNNGFTSLMGYIIERTSGQSLEQFANLHLFSPPDY
jgi:CubicO group peptidase (beta-lactamase class C family)